MREARRGSGRCWTARARWTSRVGNPSTGVLPRPNGVGRRLTGGRCPVADAPAVPQVLLVAAERVHLPEVAAIEQACFSDPWSEASFRQALDNRTVFFRVATDGAGGLVVGYVVAWFAGGEGEIANVAVAPAARGPGVRGGPAPHPHP